MVKRHCSGVGMFHRNQKPLHTQIHHFIRIGFCTAKDVICIVIWQFLLVAGCFSDFFHCGSFWAPSIVFHVFCVMKVWRKKQNASDKSAGICMLVRESVAQTVCQDFKVLSFLQVFSSSLFLFRLYSNSLVYETGKSAWISLLFSSFSEENYH